MSMRHKMVAYCCGTHGLAVGSSIEVITSVSKMKPFRAVVTISPYLEVATPTPRPFQTAAAMLLPGEVMATGWLPTCDVISARQWSCPVSARQTVHLPGKTTVWRK